MRTERRYLGLGILWGVLAVAGSGCKPAEQPQAEFAIRAAIINPKTFRSDPLVTLRLTAKDTRGNPVILSPHQISVRENGVEVPAEAMAFETGPASSVLVIDCSGSMLKDSPGQPGQSKIAVACESAKVFVDEKEPAEEQSIITFSFSHKIETKQGFTADPNLLHDAIDRIHYGYLDPSGTTACFDAVCQALNGLKGRSGRKNVVVLSDGVDNNSQITLDKAIEEARANGVTVYTIGFGDRTVDLDSHPSQEEIERAVDEKGLRRLADETGGEYGGLAPSQQVLSEIYERTHRMISQDFPLVYRSPQPFTDRHQFVVSINYNRQKYELKDSYAAGVVGALRDSHSSGSSQSDVPVASSFYWLIFLLLFIGLLALGGGPACFIKLKTDRTLEDFYRKNMKSWAPGVTDEKATCLICGFPFTSSSSKEDHIVICPVDHFPHHRGCWEATKGCGYCNHYPVKGSGLSLFMQVYYAALLGALGGLLGWLATWLLLRTEHTNIYVQDAWLCAPIGLLVGFFVGAAYGLFNQSIPRMLLEGGVGLLLGIGGGIAGACAGEKIFMTLQGGFVGRAVGWGILGMITGLMMGFANLKFDWERALRGAGGGFMGGIVGGLIFEYLIQRGVSPPLARASFVALGLIVGGCIVLLLTGGQGWLVWKSGANTNLAKLRLDLRKPNFIGADETRCNMVVKRGAAPIHAVITLEGNFVIQDRSRDFAGAPGGPFEPLRVKSRGGRSQSVRRHVLQHGDEITIGETVLRFEIREKGKKS